MLIVFYIRLRVGAQFSTELHPSAKALMQNPSSNLKLYTVSAVTLVGSAFMAAGFVVPSLQ